MKARTLGKILVIVGTVGVLAGICGLLYYDVSFWRVLFTGWIIQCVGLILTAIGDK